MRFSRRRENSMLAATFRGLRGLVVINGTQRGKPKMDAEYKGHRITASAWHNPDGWKPRLRVVWGDSNITIRSPLFKERYSTEKEAQLAGLSFAKKWIDDGKPDLRGQVDWLLIHRPCRLSCAKLKGG
jgi:hypothetical protein